MKIWKQKQIFYIHLILDSEMMASKLLQMWRDSTSIKIIWELTNISANLFIFFHEPNWQSIKSKLRARLHETRTEFKPVWDFTSIQGNFITSVHMTSCKVKLTSMKIPKCMEFSKWKTTLTVTAKYRNNYFPSIKLA